MRVKAAVVEAGGNSDDEATMMMAHAEEKIDAAAGVESYVSALIEQTKARARASYDGVVVGVGVGSEKGVALLVDSEARSGVEAGVVSGVGSGLAMFTTPSRAFPSYVHRFTSIARRNSQQHTDEGLVNNNNNDDNNDRLTHSPLFPSVDHDDGRGYPSSPPPRSIGQWIITAVNSVQVALALSLALLIGIGNCPLVLCLFTPYLLTPSIY